MNKHFIIACSLVLASCAGNPHKEPTTGPIAKLTFNETLSKETFAGKKVISVPTVHYFILDSNGCTKGIGTQFDNNKIKNKGSVNMPANRQVSIQVSFNTNSSLCSTARAYTFRNGGQYAIQPIKTRNRCGYRMLLNGKPVVGKEMKDKFTKSCAK